MVDTIKFSQMTPGGDIAPDEKTPGLLGGGNVLFNNPFPLLPPGTTAGRPPITSSMYYRLRFNTTLESYEYYSPTLSDWIQLTNSAPTLSGPILTYTADPSIINAQDLGLLTNGILKQTVLAGVATLEIAVPNVDYLLPGAPLGTMAYQDANNVNISGGSAALTAGSVLNSPVNPTDIVNKAYADSIAAGFSFKASCVLASTTNLSTTYNNGASGVGATLIATVNGALTLDGVLALINSRVLIKDQSTTYQNGIYVVTDPGSAGTPFILTRSTDFDTPAEIQPGSIIFIQDGNTQADTSFVETEIVFAVGTSPILFTQFSQQYPLSMGNGGTGASIVPVVNSLVYTNASNMALIAPANNSVLVYSAGGVPSASNTLPSGLTIPGYATSGANTDITSLTGLTGKLRAPTAIASTADLNVLGFTYTASAVNNLNVVNSITGVSPSIKAEGSDANVGITMSTKGVGDYRIESANATVPIQWYTGTNLQHTTRWNIPNTAQTRDVTLPDKSGTIAMTTDLGLVKITTENISNISQVVWSGLTGYTSYMLQFTGLSPVTNGASLIFQVSVDNGATWVASGSYQLQVQLLSGVTVTTVSSSLDWQPLSSSSLGSSSDGGAFGTLMLINANTTLRKGIQMSSYFFNSSSQPGSYISNGQITNTSAINAVRVLTTSGNIFSGSLTLWGIR